MKMLIAIDNSDYAIKVVNYVASAVKPAVKITLFSVVPTMSSNLEKMEKDLQQPLFSEKVVELRWMVDKEKKKAESRIEECLTILRNAGFSDDTFEVKMQEKVVGIARDIIAETEKGKYDTIVVGRRGLSATASFVLGSVSNKIVQNIKNCSVWIVE
ncbi:MAG: universal stress protein [Deltaproteobacteria bacterium]|nr:universal stress protein [Deltaproteobacteria bacterium]MBW1834051.1 universal stress protein [Deltaproteobacteria bacterium]MBW2165715.1 universal stress protein [Deltaproteobacteria bacterium]